MTKHREAGKGGNRMKVGVTQEEKYPEQYVSAINVCILHLLVPFQYC